MNRRKVNRFTFDAHSVVLFSALALSGAVSANTAPNSRTATSLSSTASNSVVANAMPAAVQQRTLSAATASVRKDTTSASQS